MLTHPFLSREQQRTLAAAMGRILPSGDGPGATEANAIGYADWITRQCCFRPSAACFMTGLGLLDGVSNAAYGRAFVVCDAAEQDEVLATICAMPHPTVQRFFAMLVRMAITGFLCPPHYGGNQDEVGWQFIGFVPHPMTRAGNAGEG